jgi:hypothetical protein
MQLADLSELDRIGLSNVVQGSPKMWAHVVSVYVVTYIVLKVSNNMSVLHLLCHHLL